MKSPAAPLPRNPPRNPRQRHLQETRRPRRRHFQETLQETPGSATSKKPKSPRAGAPLQDTAGLRCWALRQSPPSRDPLHSQTTPLYSRELGRQQTRRPPSRDPLHSQTTPLYPRGGSKLGRKTRRNEEKLPALPPAGAPSTPLRRCLSACKSASDERSKYFFPFMSRDVLC
jgi:hypothetical protein